MTEHTEAEPWNAHYVETEWQVACQRRTEGDDE